MTCDAIKILISEYADGQLAPRRGDQVQAHLAHCPACAQLAQDFRAMRGLLRGLPKSETSSDFEAALTARLAQTRPASPAVARMRRLSSARLAPPSLWRPALALAAAAAVVAGVAFFPSPQIPSVPTPQPPAVSDGALLAHCVQQHRSYVAAQPLSDIAAQNLANQLDNSASVPGEDSL